MTSTKVFESSDTEIEIKKSKKEANVGMLCGKDFRDSQDGHKLVKSSDALVNKDPCLTIVTDVSPLLGHLSLHFEEVRESSYSEVVMRSIKTNISSCYEQHSFIDPTILDTPIEEYCPLEMGPFNLIRVSKGDKYYLDIQAEASEEDPEIEELRQIYPQANETNKGHLILHPPNELWGYDEGRLVAAVVCSCHGDPNTLYKWYKDGQPYKSGSSLASICISQPGTYNVEVINNDKQEVSEPFKVEAAVSSRSSSACGEAPLVMQTCTTLRSETQVPVIGNEELSIGIEIGSGTFGKVFKANWVGTPVAVKVIKARNAKRFSTTIENEIKVHSSVRHPNIVQIMAVCYRKNAIYLVSEFIDGKNLEEILFSDDEESWNINYDAKIYICRQLCQAIAYLHNLNPKIIHRDIKPANVLVSAKNYLTKLCDMGISKFKLSQSLTSTTAATSLPGTPQYMAPECLLSNKNSTTASDIWSLGCTLVECFNGEDLWGVEMEAQHASDDQIASLKTILKAAFPPSSLGKVSATIPAAIQLVLSKCFDSARLRLTAIDVLGSFEQ